MNKYIYIPLLVFSLLLSTSCNKWLNLDPKSQVEATKLLTDEKGYNSALGGVYFNLSSEELYGRELTMGSIEILSQYWSVSSNTKHNYYALQRYDFTDKRSVTIIDEFWSRLYAGITQANHIIESLEVNGSTIDNSNLFAGEAYALRAFMHFELLKLYGPVLRSQADFEKPAIAYRDKFDVIARKFDSSEKVFEKIVADLKKALELMKDDPIKIKGREGDSNESLLLYNNILKRRGTRMNYYAVLGILSRVELYRGEKAAAYTYAKRLMDECVANIVGTNPVYHLNPKEIFNHNSELTRDIICQSEFLFALYRDDLYKVAGELFAFKDYDYKSEKYIRITADNYTNILNYVYGRTPDGAGTDYRLKYWFAKHDAISNSYGFVKLKQPLMSNTNPPVAYWPEIPIMKFSEIYYIACECQIGINNTLAQEYLNTVRETRGLPVITEVLTDDLLEEYLTREMRKDLFGEGQMFAYYKRKFKAINVSAKETIQPLEANFVLPIPESEYEFSPNEKPKSNN